MSTQYTNELTAELLTSIDQSPFSAAELAKMSNEDLAFIEEQAAYCREHPVTEMYRFAVAGSLTQHGGIAHEFNPDPMQGYKIQCDDGIWASVLTKGDYVTKQPLVPPASPVYPMHQRIIVGFCVSMM